MLLGQRTSEDNGLGQYEVFKGIDVPQLTPVKRSLPTLLCDYPGYLGLGDMNVKEISSKESLEDEWVARYGDFIDSFDSGNSDWIVPEDCSELLESASESLESLSFAMKYDESNWQETSTRLEGSRDNFSSPSPGPIRRNLRRPMALHEAFDAFWPQETLSKICDQTNMYAKQVPTKPRKGGLNGGTNWVDLCPDELRGFLGILLFMGLKKLPQIRLY